METETYNHLTQNHPTVDVTVPSSTTSSSAIVSSASSSSSSEPEDSFNYETVFPSLPPTQSDNNSNAVAQQHPMFANSNTAKLSIKRPNATTSVFHIPANERKKSSHPSSFGNETNKKCEEIASRLGVKVEICQSKDQSLHVVISGQEERVQEAKKAIWSEFQTERDYKMKIPREQHKYLIGKAGATLRDLQDKTCTKITVPKAETQSEFVIIHGPKDGIEHAIHEIQSIIDEQMKTSIERLEIPKLYHPWIRGFNNELSNELAQKYGGSVKINIPPPTLEKDEIVVSGDRDKVELVSTELRRIHQQKSRLNITKLAIQITKSQHKLIIGKNGSNLQEIFRDYDVYVQVPKLDSELETIYLYGEESKLGPALSQVCAKANSVVTVRIDVPSWLHRHMIGEKGANISKITADFPQTRVNFEVDNKIALEGPPDEVEKVRARLENITLGLKQVMVCDEIPIDTKLVPLMIGSKEKKTENHVAKLNKEFGVVVRLPQSAVANENGTQAQNGGQQQFSNVVRIEGAPDAVKKCRVEFIELIKRLENERSKDIIIDQKYHSTLIGKNGKNLNEIRAKFNDVQIQLPSQSEKSDIVTIRGNKLEVEKCYKHLQQFVKDLQETNYQEELQIVKEFHRIIIGKQGAFIKKIRDETQTRIDIPAEDSNSNSILITGREEQVRKAKKQIEDKIKELVQIKEDFVEISHNLHTALIGKNGNIIKHIRSECGGVIINFPPETDSNNNRIVLKGSPDQINKAKTELLKLAEQKHDSSHQEELNVKLEYHKFLVGKQGTKINSIRDKYQVRIIFPSDTNNNNNSITLIGKKENVEKARQELEQQVKSLEEQVTEEVEIDSKWHKNFTAKRAKLINKVSDDNCNVKISFPKNAESNKVQVKGPREAVQNACKRLLDLVFEFENQVTLEVNIPNKYHASVIGKKGVNTQRISDDFNVDIQFSAKQDGSETEQQSDIVTVSGLKEDCERAKEALLALVPITEQVHFPHKYHKDLLANKAEILRELTTKYNVQINVPNKEEKLDHLNVSGMREELDAARVAIEEKLHEIEVNNFTVEITGMRPDFIPQLRGKNGQEAEKLEKKYKLRIDFSKRGEPDRIVLRGVQQNVEECEKLLRKRIADEESKLSTEIEIDNRIHSRIIGLKGKNVAKVMEKFQVEIKFPDRSSNVVIVKGTNQDQIDDACDHLKNLEEDFLQDVTEKEQYAHPAHRSSGDNHHNAQDKSRGFVVKGAPWEQPGYSAPELSNMDDFPTISTAGSDSANGPRSTWGPRK